jgi:hypothetical protein
VLWARSGREAGEVVGGPPKPTVQLCCQAALNIAKSPNILAMTPEAYFCTIFRGIETPARGAKKQHIIGFVSLGEKIDRPVEPFR